MPVSYLVIMRESQQTELQRRFSLTWLTRSFEDVASHYRSVVDIRGEIAKRCEANAAAQGDGTTKKELVVLDVGCGAGTAIEEVARRAPCWFDLRGTDIKGIGVDLNPLPYLINAETLRIDPGNGRGGQSLIRSTVADIHCDDVHTLSTIPDHSVDVGLCTFVLSYAEDKLAALTSMQRVLKRDGIFVATFEPKIFTQPVFDQILDTTPNARDVLHVSKYHVPNEVLPVQRGIMVLQGSEKVLEFPYIQDGEVFPVGNYKVSCYTRLR